MHLINPQQVIDKMDGVVCVTYFQDGTTLQ